jgi:hypothetical protein
MRWVPTGPTTTRSFGFRMIRPQTATLCPRNVCSRGRPGPRRTWRLRRQRVLVSAVVLRLWPKAGLPDTLSNSFLLPGCRHFRPDCWQRTLIQTPIAPFQILAYSSFITILRSHSKPDTLLETLRSNSVAPVLMYRALKTCLATEVRLHSLLLAFNVFRSSLYVFMHLLSPTCVLHASKYLCLQRTNNYKGPSHS